MSDTTDSFDLHKVLIPDGFSVRMLIAAMLCVVPLIGEGMTFGTISVIPVLTAIVGLTLWYLAITRMASLKDALRRANSDFMVSQKQLDETVPQAVVVHHADALLGNPNETILMRDMIHLRKDRDVARKRIRRAFTAINFAEIVAFLVCCGAAATLLGPVAAILAKQVGWASGVSLQWQAFVSQHWPKLTYFALLAAEALSVKTPPDYLTEATGT